VDASQNPQFAADAKKQYQVLHDALSELIELIGLGRINDFFEQPTQQYQDNFEKAFVTYIDQNDHLYNDAVKVSENSFKHAMWMLGSVLIVLLVFIILAWTGVQRILIHPLKNIVETIRKIATGDLTHEIVVKSRNEIGQLADSLRYMQDELIRRLPVYVTVLMLFTAAPAKFRRVTVIYLPVPKNRHRRWKKLPPAWNS